MDVIRIHIETFVLRVAQTREVEADCDDCARYSAQLVEAFLHGQVQEEDLAIILQHLKECIPCSEEFSILRDCAQMDEEDSWPSMDELWNKLDTGPAT